MIRPSRLLLAATLALLLGACNDDRPAASIAAVDIDPNTTCSLDGMLLADYPGPKAQIRYEGTDEPEFFCDTVEMFSVYLNPEQARKVAAIYVQDMGHADWDQPRGNWIDARTAFYVQGSKRHGSMGPTIASFATEEGARHFAAENGGKVLKFSEVKPESVDLSGGVLHDEKM